MAEIKKGKRIMNKFNKKLGVILAISGILSGVANYFNVLATPILVVSLVIATFATFITMMQIYHYKSYQEYNPGTFWLVYSSLGGTLLVISFYAMGFKLISHTFLAIAMAIFPILLPSIGLFLGNMGRILFKGEPSVIGLITDAVSISHRIFLNFK